MVLSISILVYLGCSHSILDVVLSLTGYLIAILVKYPLSLLSGLLRMPLNTTQVRHPIGVLIALIFITSLLLLLVRKFFQQAKPHYLQNCPNHLQKLFLIEILLCICLFTAHFFYGDFVEYPLKVLLFNGIMISAFTLCTLILFFSLYEVFRNNYELSVQKKELNVMREYMDSIEKCYDEVRTFRHDYKNILSTLQYYIDANDNDGLKAYFNEKILPDQASLSNNGFTIGKLHQIKIPALKSILYTKMVSACNKNIDLAVEIEDPIEKVYMDTLDLCRVLGILLDNSIEAAAETEEKIIKIAIVSAEEYITFTLVNSTRPVDIPLSRLMKKGVTTKAGHDGLGLYTVYNMVGSLHNVSYSVSIENEVMFRQTIEIRKVV